MGYKKRPTKSELYELIGNLEQQNRKLGDELEKNQRREWEQKIPAAAMVMCEFLNKTFPGTWCNLRFEHVDAAAYWYTFELVNDSRRQTWCVRHNEVNG